MGAKDGLPGKLSTADDRMHRELADIWRDIDTDPDTRVVVIRGEGKGFSGGGDLGLVQQMADDFDVRARVWREARDLVYNIINCNKPIVSAMHGAAVGAGLWPGCLPTSPSPRATHASSTAIPAWAWRPATTRPLSGRCCANMAKAKYYLMLCETVSGEEAERIGLVSLCVDEAELIAKAFEVANKLAAGSQTAIRWTKYSLNNWLRMAGPSFDTSLALGSWALPARTCAKESSRCASAARRTSGLTRRFEPGVGAVHLLLEEPCERRLGLLGGEPRAELLGFIVQRGLDGLVVRRLSMALVSRSACGGWAARSAAVAGRRQRLAGGRDRGGQPGFQRLAGAEGLPAAAIRRRGGRRPAWAAAGWTRLPGTGPAPRRAGAAWRLRRCARNRSAATA